MNDTIQSSWFANRVAEQIKPPDTSTEAVFAKLAAEYTLYLRMKYTTSHPTLKTTQLYPQHSLGETEYFKKLDFLIFILGFLKVPLKEGTCSPDHIALRWSSIE